MTAEQILKSATNTVVEGTYIINDIKLKPFSEREGHFLTFSLQDKTGLVWSKIWDNAEHIADQLEKEKASVVTIKGRTNVYNSKVQLIIDKIKVAEIYDEKSLISVSEKDPAEMWDKLQDSMALIKDENIVKIWESFLDDSEFLKKFKIWPGGKGTVHHAYRYGLLEHTLSVLNIACQTHSLIKDKANLDKVLIGSFLHDIGKLDAYNIDHVKIEMTDIGRLHDHLALGYYMFRNKVEKMLIESKPLIEDIGHIILSHHGAREKGAVVLPMTIEAKIIAHADLLDSETNYMTKKLEHDSDEKGWYFDTMMSQFFYTRPEEQRG